MAKRVDCAPNPYRFSLIQELQDESLFRPAAQALFQRRVVDFRRDDPVTNCLPGGPSDMLASTYRIMQSPTVIALLYENGTGRHRQNQADTDMLENVCNENNRSRLVGVERAGVSIGAAVLARYERQYAFSDGSRTVAGFMGMNHKVTLVGGRLYLGARPMVPISPTTFESSGPTVEFFLDATGAVTRLVLGQTEGEAVYRPVSTPATNRRNIGK